MLIGFPERRFKGSALALLGEIWSCLFDFQKDFLFSVIVDKQNMKEDKQMICKHENYRKESDHLIF
jgi:hypothetical protein